MTQTVDRDDLPSAPNRIDIAAAKRDGVNSFGESIRPIG
jgi:hypothetical protein